MTTILVDSSVILDVATRDPHWFVWSSTMLSEYADQGVLCITPIISGVIEGACRHVVKDRLGRTGMHWTVPGAQTLLQLRCVALNGDWEAFMKRYIDQETTPALPGSNCPALSG